MQSIAFVPSVAVPSLFDRAAAGLVLSVLLAAPAVAQDPSSSQGEGFSEGARTALMAAAGAGPGPSGVDGDLLAAARSGDAEAVAAALTAGASVDASAPSGGTALHLAVAAGSVEAVERLLAAGADPKASGALGATPLHGAGRGAGSSGREIATRLLAAGAEIEARDDQGRTPLHAAAFDGNPAVLELLLERGAEIEAADADGNHPLHLAVQSVLLIDRVAASMNRGDLAQANHEIVERLLARGADPDARSRTGMTPLHQAARYGHRVLVDRLLAAGADPRVTDAGGLTAAQYAHEHPEIAALLVPPAEPAADGG